MSNNTEWAFLYYTGARGKTQGRIGVSRHETAETTTWEFRDPGALPRFYKGFTGCWFPVSSFAGILLPVKRERKCIMIDFNRKKGFICDMDGVLYHGNRVLPGAVEFIDWLQRENKEYLFLTNNSGYTPKELRQKLARMGLEVPEEHFYTSALATAAFLKEQAPGCSVYAIGEAGLLNALYDAGITMNDVNPDYVIMGEGKAYSLDTLTKATNLVRKGAKLIGANSDISGPIEDGIAPACRALVAPIELATGKQAYFCGKPNPLMMRTGLNILGCHSGEAVMVGDRMDTDVISGMECGMSTVLVLSGVSTRETVSDFAYRPTVVLDGVGDIARLADSQK